MRRLWQRMADLLGHRWTSSFGSDAGTGAGKTWAEELGDLTLAQLAVGLRSVAVMPSDWWPSVPAFRELCFAVPSFALVRAEIAMKNARRSPFTLLTYEYLDRHRHAMAPADQADRLLREAYDVAREHVMRGGALPEIPEELSAPPPEERVPASESTVRASCAAIEAILGRVDPEPADEP